MLDAFRTWGNANLAVSSDYDDAAMFTAYVCLLANDQRFGSLVQLMYRYLAIVARQDHVSWHLQCGPADVHLQYVRSQYLFTAVRNNRICTLRFAIFH